MKLTLYPINSAATRNPYKYLYGFVEAAGLMGTGTFLRVDKKTGAAGQSTLSSTGIYFVEGSSTTDPVYDSGYLLAVTNGVSIVQLKLCINTRKVLYRAGAVGSLGSWVTIA